jgi:hypothetical protein
MIGWDVALDRELRGRSSRTGVTRALRSLRRRSIVLLHDAHDDRAVEAPALLLRGLRRRGLHSRLLAGA